MTAMPGYNPSNIDCQECAAILRQLRDVWRVEYKDLRERVRDAWLASGLELQQFYKAYLSRALDELSADFESNERFRVEFPKFSEMRRKASEHELLTGHSVGVNGWRYPGIGGDLTSWFR